MKELVFGCIIVWTPLVILLFAILKERYDNYKKEKNQDYTPKEKYEKIAIKLREEDIKYNRYEIKWKSFSTYIYFPSTEEKFEVGIDENDWTILYWWYKNEQTLKIQEILKEKAEKEKEKKEYENNRLKQLSEDKEYSEKLRKLLKIKPLDKDLQEDFKKANRIIEIWKEIWDLTKELYKLRK